VKIDLSQQLDLPLQLFAMQLENRLNFISVRAMFASALPLPNVYQVCVTLYLLEQR
jgi:hypothetical protein